MIVVERLDGGIMKLCSLRRELFNGREDLCDEYLLGKRSLTLGKRLSRKDFDGSRKEFWAFVGRRTKGKRKNNMLRNGVFF